MRRLGGVARLSLSALAAALLALAGFAAQAQEAGSVVSEKGIATPTNRFRLKAEIKVNGRSSADETATIRVGAPPTPVVARTVSPHGSFEISNVALLGEGDLTPDLSARLLVHYNDLYTRNPTSTGATLLIREAWLRFGKKFEALQPQPGTTFYVEVGKAPRFSKQLARRFENYGLWGTAVARLEEIGAEAGGSLGTFVYWRAAISNGNPLFIRDPNSLAGNNGAIDRTNAAAATSGFPILYEARADDLNGRGQFQYGGGLGLRFNFGEERRDGVDVLGWYFRRTLGDRPGSSELDLLRGFGGVPLAFDTVDHELADAGVNVEARVKGLQLYGQLVRQDVAGLVRRGFEVELAYRIQLNGLFVSGDSPVLNWIQPTARVSRLLPQYKTTPGYFAPSIGWDWTKIDLGFRLGILRGLDLTFEYTREDVTTATTIIHPDEGLLTLRLGI